MNEFEKRSNTLRLQFKTEQCMITKECYRKIGRLNSAIAMVNSDEAREALRAEKEKTYEAMHRSHELNKTCYLQQLELLNEEHLQHLKRHPSNRQLRRLLALFCTKAEASGQKALSISFGQSRRAHGSFI